MGNSVHKCPVCNGECEKDNKPCKSCKGKGYVEVKEADEKKASKRGMTKYGAARK